MKRYPPALFRIEQEKPAGHVQFTHRSWIVWEWDHLFGRYEYYVFAFTRDDALAVVDRVLRRRRGRGLIAAREVPC